MKPSDDKRCAVSDETAWEMCRHIRMDPGREGICEKCPAFTETNYGAGTQMCRTLAEDAYRTALSLSSVPSHVAPNCLHCGHGNRLNGRIVHASNCVEATRDQHSESAPSTTRQKRRSDDKVTPMATLLRTWAHNESTKHPYAAYTGPNQYLVDLLNDAADEMDRALSAASAIRQSTTGEAAFLLSQREGIRCAAAEDSEDQELCEYPICNCKNNRPDGGKETP